MKTTDKWMPLWVGDFLAATNHLSNSEAGAYLLLLMNAWIRDGKLPADDTQLCRMARCGSVEEWMTMRPLLEPFFDTTSGFWVQARLLKEKEMAIEKSETRKRVGALGGRSKRRSNRLTNSHSKTTPIGEANQEAKPKQTETPSPSQCTVPLIDSPKPEVVVLHHLIEKTGREFREVESNLDPIRSRLSEPGVTVGEVLKMIDRMVVKWKGGEWDEYLNPETLFRKSKFTKYYDNRNLPVVKPTVPIRDQLSSTDELLSMHVANPEAKNYNGHPTEEQKAEFRELQKKRLQLVAAQAKGEV